MSFTIKKEIIDISRYPYLRDNYDIRRASKVLQDAQQALELVIQSAQCECLHPKFEKILEDNIHKGMYDYRGDTICTGKECTKCAKFFPRKAGMPWKVCYACGEDMLKTDNADLGVVQYNCTLCRNTAWKRSG